MRVTKFKSWFSLLSKEAKLNDKEVGVIMDEAKLELRPEELQELIRFMEYSGGYSAAYYHAKFLKEK